MSRREFIVMLVISGIVSFVTAFVYTVWFA